MAISTRVLNLGLAGVLIVASGAAADARQERSAPLETLTLTTPFDGGTTRHVDLGKKGISAGDLFLGTGAPVYAQGKRIGTMDGVETIVSAAHDGTVSQQGTLRLAGGNIMLEGIGRHTDTPFRLAVVGGTGNYAFARGQLTVLREDDSRGVVVFRLIVQR